MIRLNARYAVFAYGAIQAAVTTAIATAIATVQQSGLGWQFFGGVEQGLADRLVGVTSGGRAGGAADPPPCAVGHLHAR
jgi:hypothetical protein